MTRLVDAVRAAGEQAYKRILSGPIDAAEPQDGDRTIPLAAQRLPCEFGFDARAAARMRRNGRRGFIDPSAAVIAVHAGRREIDDRLQAWRRRDVAAEHRKHRIVSLARRGRDQQVAHVREGAMQFVRPVLALEHEQFDRFAGDLVRIARRADHARKACAEFGHVVAGAVAKSDTDERGHRAPIRCARSWPRQSPCSSARCRLRSAC